jgi:hypothetical protein
MQIHTDYLPCYPFDKLPDLQALFLTRREEQPNGMKKKRSRAAGSIKDT